MNTIVLGAGLSGLAAGMMLARDGHRVTVLERDPAPVPDSPEDAWDRWDRDGVAQFRQAHFMQARGTHVLAAELPDVQRSLETTGALRLDPVARMPSSITDRDARPGDERLATWNARRTTLEQVLGQAAESQDGLEVRRGVSVAELQTRRIDGRLHVTGVRDDGGEPLAADLVVDAMGRRSVLPKLLTAAGGDPVHEEAEDCGFLYYTRFFRSADGRVPAARAPLLSHIGSFSILTIPADAGVWSVTLYASSRDQPLKRLREPSRWSALVRACPLHAHWLDGEPITGILPMGGVIDRYRRIAGNGARPVGIASLGDAWACTNPSLGRGMALGLSHAALLRQVVGEHGDNPADLASAWDEATEREMAPWYRATVAVDRARLAEIDAIRSGAETSAAPPGDVAARVRAALPLATMRDPDVFRAGLEIAGCLTMPPEVFARPGLAQRVLEAAGDGAALPGPSREQVLQVVTMP
jgi:2-polyprenyl-6-methoxyphenol hydroxylase-like FAD-dependent oxidoreductase